MNEKDEIFLKHIQESIDKIESFVSGMSEEEFNKDEKTQYAVIRALEVIGEAIKKISEEIISKYPNNLWKEYAGQRDILIHQYFGIDIEKVWKVIIEELPILKSNINQIINQKK